MTLLRIRENSKFRLKRKKKRKTTARRFLKEKFRRRLVKPEFKQDGFYESDAWRALRYDALRLLGRRCALCRRQDGEMHVDHIEPRSLAPSKQLDINNLQILCKECNLGKGNRDQTDFRSGAQIKIIKDWVKRGR